MKPTKFLLMFCLFFLLVEPFLSQWDFWIIRKGKGIKLCYTPECTTEEKGVIEC